MSKVMTHVIKCLDCGESMVYRCDQPEAWKCAKCGGHRPQIEHPYKVKMSKVLAPGERRKP
jgi:ribosomal protein L37AE/L43A